MRKHAILQNQVIFGKMCVQLLIFLETKLFLVYIFYCQNCHNLHPFHWVQMGFALWKIDIIQLCLRKKRKLLGSLSWRSLLMAKIKQIKAYKIKLFLWQTVFPPYFLPSLRNFAICRKCWGNADLTFFSGRAPLPQI